MFLDRYEIHVVVKMLFFIIVITVITSCIIHVPIIPHSVITNKLNEGIQHIYIHILVVHDLVKNIYMYTGLKNCTIIFTEYS